MADLDDQLIMSMARYSMDPYGFVMFAFPWGEAGTPLENKTGPREWQREVLDRIGRDLRAGGELGAVIREAIASGHGIGKSALIAWIALWSMSTFPDTRGVATANTESQLRTKTWPELSKWHRMCITKPWFVLTATALYSSDPEHEKTWRIDAIPWSEHNSEAFAGLHNQGLRIIVLFDESSKIADIIWEVTEGALTDERTQIIWIAFGNPTRNTGRFRECFRKFRKRWSVRQIDSRTVEGTNRKQISEWEQDHDANSDFFKIRVRGEFPSQSALQFISEDDVRAAQSRHLRKEQYDFAPKILTLDNAWTGDDKIVIGLRQGLYFKILRKLSRNDNDIEIANMLAQLEDEHEADAVFIDGGFGTGVVSAGKTMGRNWQIVWFSEKPYDEGYLNKRAEMWGEAKRWLKAGGALENDDELFYDLTGPETVPRMDGKIQLESKEDMKARGLTSPNCGDALCLSFAHPVVSRRKMARSLGRNIDQAQSDWKPL